MALEIISIDSEKKLEALYILLTQFSLENKLNYGEPIDFYEDLKISITPDLKFGFYYANIWLAPVDVVEIPFSRLTHTIISKGDIK